MEGPRVFIHGLESSGHGTKGTFFRERYPGMIIEDYAGSFAERMERLESLLAGRRGLVLVGSSYGGLMAAVYAFLHEERVEKLVLLAPALHLEPLEPYRKRKLQVPTVIYHGTRDDVVPLEAVRTIAEQIFTGVRFHVVDDDHSLHETFPSLDWDALLAP